MWIYRVRYEVLRNYSLVNLLTGQKTGIILTEQGPQSLMTELRRTDERFFLIRSNHSKRTCFWQFLKEGRRFFEKEIQKILLSKKGVTGPVIVESTWLTQTEAKALFEKRKRKPLPIRLRRDKKIFVKCVCCGRDPKGEIVWVVS